MIKNIINYILIIIILVSFLMFCGVLATLIIDFILSKTDNEMVIKALSNNFIRGVCVFLPIALILSKIFSKIFEYMQKKI